MLGIVIPLLGSFSGFPENIRYSMNLVGSANSAATTISGDTPPWVRLDPPRVHEGRGCDHVPVVLIDAALAGGLGEEDLLAAARRAGLQRQRAHAH